MGLHPRAITSFMFVVMELIYRGYSVVLSTHSPAVLELAWALRMLKRSADPVAAFCRLFGESRRKEMAEMATTVLGKSMKVHFFKPADKGTRSVDISGMDPGGIDDEADWGGLTEQSSLIARVVAESAPSYETGRGEKEGL